MNKVIKFTVFILFLPLLVAFIYYCVQYYTRDLSYYEQKVEQLEEENFTNKSEIAKYLAQIEEDKKTINSLNEQILQYQEQNTTNQETISALEASKQQLETQVENLTESNNSNLAIIAENETTISNLQAQVEQLQSTVGDNTEQIEQLNNTISSLQNINSQLQQSNEDNLTTISSLNSQIESLNEQISDLIEQSQNNSSIVNSLNAQIAQLQQTIEYYEEFVSQFEAGDKVIATFEFDGSVYSVQIVDKNSTLTIEDPTSTDYVQFNYWTVDGEQVDLSSYTITQSTTFVANVTHKYDVKFMVDDQVHNSQIVVENGFATLPENPTKEGYEFDGWSINGIDIVSNITTTQVNSNVTYKAVFTQLHTVTFMSDGEIKSTQSVRNGECATNVDIESTTYKVFNGWKIDSDIINISEYPIYSSVVFIADYTNKYDVKFMVDGQVYDSQIVEENGYATLPETPTKEGYIFEGWFLGGLVEIIIPEWKITSNITLTAKFNMIDLNTLEEIEWNIDIEGKYVWNYDGNTYYSNGSDSQYKLNKKTKNWEVMYWNGFTDFEGSWIWFCNNNVYCSNGSSDVQYMLNKETFTWEQKEWNINVNPLCLWSDGEDVYSSFLDEQYKLNQETEIWEPITWNISVNSLAVWTDGENIYHESDFKLNKETMMWDKIDIECPEQIAPTYIWRYKDNTYFAEYVFNKETKIWENKSWNSELTPLGADIWTDGEYMYYSYFSVFSDVYYHYIFTYV